MTSSKLTGFTASYAETLALAFANSSLICRFSALLSIFYFCSISSSSATNLATQILLSGSIFLDAFDRFKDFHSFDVFNVFDSELLLLLDEPFDWSSSSELCNQYVIYLWKEGTWLWISWNHNWTIIDLFHCHYISSQKEQVFNGSITIVNLLMILFFLSRKISHLYANPFCCKISGFLISSFTT